MHSDPRIRSRHDEQLLDHDDYRWLVSEAAAPWLALVAVDQRPTLQIAAALRKDLSPMRAHLILEQIDLRKRAKQKFPRGEHMFFTRKCLEQSTDYWLAHYKAARYTPSVRIVDLCCGIGGDAIALAERGPVLAVDSDLLVTILAEANAAALGLAASLNVATEDVTESKFADSDLWHLDPDRRPGGQRVTRLDTSLPSRKWFDVFQQQHGNGALKLAPGDSFEARGEEPIEWEYISRDGEVRQQVVYFGSLAQTPFRCTCTSLSRDGQLLGQFHSAIPPRPAHFAKVIIDDEIPMAERIGAYLYEPEPTILAAGLERPFANQHGLSFTSPTRGYLTSDIRAHDPMLSTFRVLETLQFDRKRVAALLRDRQVGTVEVKTRDKALDTNRLQREFSTRGGENATLILTRFQEKTWAVLCERILMPGYSLNLLSESLCEWVSVRGASRPPVAVWAIAGHVG